MTTPTRAHFARTVQGKGPGLLLAHGAGGGIEANYGPIMEGLAARHTVVGIDYPGSGSTPVAQGRIELDALVDQLIAAADDEGLGTFAVSGYSLGGPVAIGSPRALPGARQRTRAERDEFAHADTRTELAASIWQQLYEAGRHTVLAAFLNLMALGEPALNALTPAQVHTAVEQLAASLPAGTPGQVDLVRRIDVRDDLARITAPTLAIVTTADPLISPALQRELAAAVPTAEIAEIPTGHLPFAEQPEQWLKLISDFLDRTAKG